MKLSFACLCSHGCSRMMTVAIACLALGNAVSAGTPQPIFNGKNLDGWQVPSPNPFWTVSDGVLKGENDAKLQGNMLYTRESYGDFVLEADVRFQGEIDSGFMVRKPELQLQIGVSRSLNRDMTCCFYTGGLEKYPESGQGKGVEKLLKADDWNTIRLQAKGDTFSVWLNGTKVVDYVNPKYAGPGPIGLQIHGGLKMAVEFRNLRVMKL